jgi:hypothetical protein
MERIVLRCLALLAFLVQAAFTALPAHAATQSPFSSAPAASVSAGLTVRTNPAQAVTGTAARLEGTIDSLGSAGSANVSFEWGTSSGNYTSQSASSQNVTEPASFSENISGLARGKTYYFRAVATAGNLTAQGGELLFYTAEAPEVSTGNATDISRTSAILHGALVSPGSASSANVSFEWRLGLSGSYAPTANQTNAGGAFEDRLTGLIPGSKYYFRAVASGDNLTSRGSDQAFTTETLTAPAVSTGAPTGLTSTSAVLNGSLNALGSASTVSVSFEYRLGTNGDFSATAPETRASTGVFRASLAGLTPNATYEFRARAAGDMTGTGDIVSFSTAGTLPPAPGPASGGAFPGVPTGVLAISGFASPGTLSVDLSGAARETVTLECSGYNSSLYIAAGTRLLDSSGRALTTIQGGAASELPAPPPQAFIVQSLEFGPGGATFTPAIVLTMRYDAASLPAGSDDGDLYIAFWNGTLWVAAPSAADTTVHAVTAQITHFSQYALVGKLPEPRSPARVADPGIQVAPESAAPAVGPTAEATTAAIAAVHPTPSPTSPATATAAEGQSKSRSEWPMQWWLIAVAAAGASLVSTLIILVFRADRDRHRDR